MIKISIVKILGEASLQGSAGYPKDLKYDPDIISLTDL